MEKTDSEHTGRVESSYTGIWSVFTSDIKCIEGVGAVSTQFETVILSLGEFFAGFIFLESVAPTRYSGRLYCENKVVVVLSVEIWRKAVKAGETTVD